MNNPKVELMESMNIDKRLDYAEKLVFGYDDMEQNLAVCMQVIKVEAQSGNPKVEFLMYKVNILKGKVNAAMDWLERAYRKGYGDALAMTYYEYVRGNFRNFGEKELLASLDKAVEIAYSGCQLFQGVFDGAGVATIF